MKRLGLSGVAFLSFALLPLSGQDNSPLILFDQQTRDFGKVLEGETLKHVFKFTNKGKSTLEIFKVEPS